MAFGRSLVSRRGVRAVAWASRMSSSTWRRWRVAALRAVLTVCASAKAAVLCEAACARERGHWERDRGVGNRTFGIEKDYGN